VYLYIVLSDTQLAPAELCLRSFHRAQHRAMSELEAAANEGQAQEVQPSQAELEAEQKRAEKERRRKEFEARNKDKLASKPKLSKKERREKQEREKAAKQAGVSVKNAPKVAGQASNGASSTGNVAGGNNNASGSVAGNPGSRSFGGGSVAESAAAQQQQLLVQQVQQEMAQKQSLSNVFAHLTPFRPQVSSASMQVDLGEDNKVHPAVISVGLKFASGDLRGSNTRMVAMLQAFKEVIADYSRPENASVARDLDRRLKPMIQFLIDCRPHSISMGNAIKHLRHAISALPPDLTEAEAKEELFDVIDTYVHTNVTLAQKELVRIGLSKISNGDVILTFGRNGAVEKLLLAAHEQGVRFEVVVVSCRPDHDGEDIVKRLASAGIPCTFIVLSSISYMMGSVTKVILGAAAMLSNGTMLGQAGTALVAMMAKSMRKPVLVCCESHKFSERVQLDSITNNEIGDPDALVLPEAWDGVEGRPTLASWRENPQLELLNLRYDLTPQAYISVLVTEFGLVPATSVPVIVREKEEVML